MTDRVGYQKEYQARYYVENNVDRLLDAAERRVEELKLLKEIQKIDAKMKRLNAASKLYPPLKADNAQPCALDIPPALS